MRIEKENGINVLHFSEEDEKILGKYGGYMNVLLFLKDHGVGGRDLVNKLVTMGLTLEKED